MAPRPIITPSTAYSSNIRIALTGSLMSPLPKTGIDTASLARRIQLQSASPFRCWARVRPCTVNAFAPSRSKSRAFSTIRIESWSHPSRVLTVTGNSTAFTMPATMAAIFSGSRRSPAPAPLHEATLLVGHPMLMSIRSGPACSAIRAASTITSTWEP